MENYIAIALSLVAVILSIVILTKVNKILDNLHTPIVKKLTPDMNLKPNSRRPVGAQEMAQRGDRNNKDHGKDRQNNKDARGDKQAQPAQNRDRNEQRSDRGQRRDRREGRPDRPRREFNKPAEATAPAAAEARRPLAPRIPVETPAAPAVEAAPAVAAPAAAEVAPVETTFDPSKVRYGRRNVIKKAPELADEA
ncbi:hypothetical protein [Fibrobacter sp. UWR2]|uniref:hypothetical protein n=1 Tax=Fibrobacter sp. UWR2 TaxID=1964352 RepID=UPI000B520D48|nr:hypothetical protein [Fibrobacter sp. UWR2]OWV02363.1 hypothetical protein B7994_03950 [Fibrobacter sp. UWR2]